MSTTSLTNVFRELFVAPLNAVTQAEADYRQIWAAWLEDQLRLLATPDGKLKEGASLEKVLDTAPIINLDGVIEVGITMRIASVQEFNASADVGLAVGPIFVSGGFGFMNRTTQESIFQASARFTLSNHEKNLKKYLMDRNIPVTNPKEVSNAVDILKKSALPATK